jgi:FKBP-type peptidyl-prolyl cis-trans isomerase SlpA
MTEYLIKLVDVLEAQNNKPLTNTGLQVGSRVKLHFQLSLTNGQLIDGCYDKAAAQFVIGDGSMLPTFEASLLGMHPGEERECTLSPENAFGEQRKENIQRFPRYRFPPDMVLESGLMLEFSDKAANTQPGVVHKVNSRFVEIDFNHPLAGRTIVFKAILLELDNSAL